MSRPTQVPLLDITRCAYGSFTLFAPSFHYGSASCDVFDEGPYNPDLSVNTSVWALPLSLATTQGIDCFFLFLQVLRCFSSLRSLSARAE